MAGPNPYASPASQPQTNVMNQFNATGVDMTPGMRGIASYRARGGAPIGYGQPRGGSQANGPLNAARGALQNLQRDNAIDAMGDAVNDLSKPAQIAGPRLGGISGGAPGQVASMPGTNPMPGQRATGPGAIRPPRRMPTRALRQ